MPGLGLVGISVPRQSISPEDTEALKWWLVCLPRAGQESWCCHCERTSCLTLVLFLGRCSWFLFPWGPGETQLAKLSLILTKSQPRQQPQLTLSTLEVSLILPGKLRHAWQPCWDLQKDSTCPRMQNTPSLLPVELKVPRGSARNSTSRGCSGGFRQREQQRPVSQ